MFTTALAAAETVHIGRLSDGPARLGCCLPHFVDEVFPMHISRRVLEAAEDQHLATLQLAGQKLLQPLQLAVASHEWRSLLVQPLEERDVLLHVVAQLAQIELVQVDLGKGSTAHALAGSPKRRNTPSPHPPARRSNVPRVH
jgi:hypothetical protein